MTFRTRANRHIRSQAAQRCRLRDVDMTGGALGDVLFTSVPKLYREAINYVRCNVGFVGELVATRAVVIRRLLSFPMTVKTRSVTGG